MGWPWMSVVAEAWPRARWALLPELPARLAGDLFATLVCPWILALTNVLSAWLAGSQVSSFPSTVGLHSVLALSLGLVLGLVLAVDSLVLRLRPRARPYVTALLVAGVVATPWIALGQDLAAGDWVKRQSFAPALRFATPVAGVLLTAVAAVALVWAGGKRRLRATTFGLLGATGLGLSLADGMAYPGLYQWPHRMLYVYAVGCLLLGVGFFSRHVAARLPSVARRWAGVVSLLGVVGFIVLGVTPNPAARAGLMTAAETPAEILLPILPKRQHDSVLRALQAMPRARPRTTAAHPWHGRAKSVILVVVDNLRADTLPPARGADGPIVFPGDTPFLDGWLEGTFRFEHAYSQASATARSVPAMHRSVEPWEGITDVGLPLPELAHQHGLKSVAIVPEYFVVPADPHARALPEGFDRLAVYSFAKQQALVKMADRAFGALRDERFIAWVHFYCVHQPGSFYERRLTSRDGDSVWRYRRSVQWLDTQMKLLIENLQRQGLADSTAVILTADHGDQRKKRGRLGHGQFVSQEELHVPMVLSIPGVAGKVLDGPVSTLDLIPTALDLLGLPPHQLHRGRSLLPALSGTPLPEDHTAYSESASGTALALFRGHDKLVLSPKEGAFAVYELDSDPQARVNRFGASPGRDEALQTAMVYRNPAAFAEALSRRSTRAALEDRLAAAQLDWPRRDLRLLLQLTALSHSRRPLELALAQFDRTPRGRADPEGNGLWLRLEILSALARRSPDEIGKRLVDEVRRALNQPEEIPLICGLAARGQPPFSEALVAKRLAELAAADPEQLQAWLGLVSPWKKRRKIYLPSLSKLLVGSTASADPRSLALVLENIASLDGRGTEARPESTLDERITSYLEHPDSRVRLQAARALGVVGGRAAIAGLRGLLKSRRRDPPTREAALESLVALEGAGAMDVLLEQRPDSTHALTVVRLIRRLKDPRGVPILRKIQKLSTSQTARAEARKVIRELKQIARRRRQASPTQD